MINIKEKIRILKNESNSTEYNRAIDDVLNLFTDQFKSCRIVHQKSGLYFNGFSDPRFNKGKNTLSTTNFAKIIIGNKTDKKIIADVFQGHLTERNGIQYVYNDIIYDGSEVAKILAKYYNELDYLPVEDFIVEKDF